jgi:hypothetical protein
MPPILVQRSSLTLTSELVRFEPLGPRVVAEGLVNLGCTILEAYD